MGEALQLGREVAAAQALYNTPEAVETAAHEAAQREHEAAQQAVSEAELRLSQEEEMDAMAASLSLLVEHGERLGLHDDHCPLCAAYRTSDEFAAGLAAARRRITSLASGIQAARDALATVKQNAQQPSLTLQTATGVIQAHADELRRLRDQEAAHVDFYDQWGSITASSRILTGWSRWRHHCLCAFGGQAPPEVVIGDKAEQSKNRKRSCGF